MIKGGAYSPNKHKSRILIEKNNSCSSFRNAEEANIASNNLLPKLLDANCSFEFKNPYKKCKKSSAKSRELLIKDNQASLPEMTGNKLKIHTHKLGPDISLPFKFYLFKGLPCKRKNGKNEIIKLKVKHHKIGQINSRLLEVINSKRMQVDSLKIQNQNVYRNRNLGVFKYTDVKLGTCEKVMPVSK